MSFILDALKKSETERQRQAGPALLEMRIVRPIAPVAGLGAGRRRAADHQRRRVGVAGVAAGAGTGHRGGRRQRRRCRSVPAMDPPPTARRRARRRRARLPTRPDRPWRRDNPGSAPAAAPRRRSRPRNPPTWRRTTIRPTRNRRSRRRPAAAEASSTANLHTYAELGGSLPELRLDLHVYATNPAERYAFINMHKVHEGDTTRRRRAGEGNHARRRGAGVPRHRVPARAPVTCLSPRGVQAVSSRAGRNPGRPPDAGVGDKPRSRSLRATMWSGIRLSESTAISLPAR